MDVLESTPEIVLNASSTISVSHAGVQLGDDVEQARELVVDHAKQRVTIKLSTTLQRGSKIKLHLNWTGKLRDDMIGMQGFLSASNGPHAQDRLLLLVDNL